MWPAKHTNKRPRLTKLLIHTVPGQEISVEFRRTLRKSILWNSLEELERYFRTVPQDFHTFPQNGKNVRKSVEKRSLYGNPAEILQKSCGNPVELGENVWKSYLVEIWFELASELDLNCSENVKNYCKKSCYLS